MMRIVKDAHVSLKWLYRGLKHGEWRWLFMAVMVATLTVTTVDLLAQSLKQSMIRQASINLGADLVIRSTQPIDNRWLTQAKQKGLRTAQSETVVTMANFQDRFQLIQLNAVDDHYPLYSPQAPISPTQSDKNALPSQDRLDSQAMPAKGTVWIQTALKSQLGISLQDSLSLGQRQLTVSRLFEPQGFQAGLDAFAYQVRMRLDELKSTGLVGPGSRVQYEMAFAGPQAAIQKLSVQLRQSAPESWQILSSKAPSEDVKQSLDTAWLFLELSSLSAVLVAGMGIIISSAFYLKRWQNSLALMRAVGANQSQLLRLFAMQMSWLALFAGGIGSTLGLGVFYLLVPWLERFFDPLVIGSVAFSWFKGVGLGVMILWTFAWPSFRHTLSTPALFLLKRRLNDTTAYHWAVSLIFMAFVSVSLVSLSHLVWVIGGLVIMALILFAGAYLLRRSLIFAQHRARGWLKLALASLVRTPQLVTQQVVALGLVLYVLMLMTFVRQDLITQWQASLPEKTPNTFLVNVQPDQKKIVSERVRVQAEEAPMVAMARGRLVEINHQSIQSAQFDSRRAQRLLSREANVGIMNAPPEYNTVTKLLPKPKRNAQYPWVSVEQGIAELLGLKLGDILTFRFAGRDRSYQLTSLRQVNWQSFRLNFFFIVPPSSKTLVDSQQPAPSPVFQSELPISYLSSFYVGSERESQRLAQAIAQAAPGVVLVDVRHLLEQIQTIMQQASWAVTGLYGFTLLASLIVVFAATLASEQTRYQTWLLLRTLGATQSVIVKTGLSEFALLGGAAAVLAAVFAQFTGTAISLFWLEIEPSWNPLLWLTSLVAGTGGLLMFGWLSQRKALRMTPKALSRRLTDV